jgi:hypothetical protein
MSTKTTFKRIALVAVASLGFGVLTSVAPASATANLTPTAVSAGTASVHRPGIMGSTTITVTHPAAAEDTDTFVVSARVMSAPATSRLFNNTVDTFNTSTEAARRARNYCTALTWSLRSPSNHGYLHPGA